jgi:sn-glycerol 3-phosphate transport system substrate-binding protein
LFANTTLLASAGITELPRTWAELASACAALAGRAGHGVVWANHGWLTQEAVAVQGGLLATPDNGRGGRAERIDLTSRELADWLRWWRELHRAGHYLYTGSPDDWEGAFMAFVEGKVAFAIDSSKAADAFSAIGAQAGFEIALAPMPHNQDRPRGAAFVSGDAFWLTADVPAQVRDGALALALRLTGTESAAGWHREHGFTPATESAAAELAGSGWFDAHPHRTALTELARVDTRDPAALGPVFGVADAVNELLASAAHDVLTGDVDPETALRHAADRAAGLGTDLDRPEETP